MSASKGLSSSHFDRVLTAWLLATLGSRGCGLAARLGASLPRPSFLAQTPRAPALQELMQESHGTSMR
eukprot:scaffold188183_cov35-Tisochrysis_lutea.AAC.2